MKFGLTSVLVLAEKIGQGRKKGNDYPAKGGTYMETINFKKDLKELYTAGKKIKEIRAEKGSFLRIEGQGEPGGVAYSEAIDILYSVVYTMKFSLKDDGVLDFAVPPLETLWQDGPDVPRKQWRWDLLIRIPDAVTPSHIAAAKKELKKKKGSDTSVVRRRTFAEGTCYQKMHIGPYDTLGETYESLIAYIEEQHLKSKMPAHEIYLSDPRRAAPERLKTIVRLPIRRR